MDRYFKERIESITDDDLFASLRTAAALPAGRRQAYAELANRHAATMAPEADRLRERISRMDAAALRRSRREADQVLRYDIRGWHTHRRKFKGTIDFNADFGQSGQYGFHYLGWLNSVVNTYVASGDSRYREGFLEIMRQYYAQRTRIVPRIKGLNPVYYELGARAKTSLLLPAYALLSVERALTVGQREELLKLLLGFARNLYRLQRDGYRAGNWQIVGCVSLYHLGAIFPEFRDASRWRRRAAERLRQHAVRDFFSDGGHGERCWGYGSNCVNAITEFYEIGAAYGLLTPDEQQYWRRFLRRAFRWFATAAGPGNFLLDYNDGNLAPMTGLIAKAKQLFPQWAAKPDLFGVDLARSTCLKPSGYAFMRTRADAAAPFMSINFGPGGGGHTHPGLLDFSLWCFGQPLLQEVGRFGSYDSPLNPLFRSPAAHNQIVIEHRPMNRDACRGEDVHWLSSAELDVFSARHRAWPGVEIRRMIAFVKPSWWFIYDVITATEYIFQAASYLHALRPFGELEPGRLQVTGSLSCLIQFAEPGALRRLRREMDFVNETAAETQALGYHYAEARYRLAAMKWHPVGTVQPIRFGMLAMPFAGARAPAAEIAPVPVHGDGNLAAAAYRVRVADDDVLLIFNPDNCELSCQRKTVTAHAAVRIGRNWSAM